MIKTVIFGFEKNLYGPAAFFQEHFILRPRIKELGIKPGRYPLFNSVYIESRTRCNGSCVFCAASLQQEKRKDITMPWELCKKIIDELKAIDFQGIVAPYVNNEPLLIPYLSDFVDYARRMLPKAWIQIQTNGKALNEKILKELLRAGLDEMQVNIYQKNPDEDTPEIINKIRKETLPSLLAPGRLRIGTMPALSEPSASGVFMFNVALRNENEILTSRAGTSPNKNYKSGIKRGFCEYPFTQLNLTADGRVAKCCADLFFSDPMGNIKDNTIEDIWFGGKFNTVRELLLQGKREAIETCSLCDFNGVKKRPRFAIGLLKLYHLMNGFRKK